MNIKILMKQGLKVIAWTILVTSLLLLLYSTFLNDFNTRLLGFMLLPMGLVLFFIQKAIEQKMNNQPMVQHILIALFIIAAAIISWMIFAAIVSSVSR